MSAHVSARRTAFSAKNAAEEGSSSTRSNASFSATASPGLTSNPLWPSFTSSGTPPTRVATTGMPWDIASMRETGTPSEKLASTTTSAVR